MIDNIHHILNILSNLIIITKKSRHFAKMIHFYYFKIFFLITLSFLSCDEKKKKEADTMNQVLKIPLDEGKWKKAFFAGGCFWCMEAPFDKRQGVKSTISGYAGGTESNPTYAEVSSGRTGHTEVVMVEYDSNKVTYKELLEIFWMNINPTQKNGQFYDIGYQYRTAIFYLNEMEKKLAEESKLELEKSKRFKDPIVTEIVQIKEFWKAEAYHQDYYLKNPVHYYRYRKGSGRDSFLKKYW